MMEGFSVPRGPVPTCLAVPWEKTFKISVGKSIRPCCLSSFPEVTGNWGSGMEARQPWTLSLGCVVDMENGWVELKGLCTTAIFQKLEDGNKKTQEIHLHTWPSLTAARHAHLHRQVFSFRHETVIKTRWLQQPDDSLISCELCTSDKCYSVLSGPHEDVCAIWWGGNPIAVLKRLSQLKQRPQRMKVKLTRKWLPGYGRGKAGEAGL